MHHFTICACNSLIKAVRVILILGVEITIIISQKNGYAFAILLISFAKEITQEPVHKLMTMENDHLQSSLLLPVKALGNMLVATLWLL